MENQIRAHNSINPVVVGLTHVRSVVGIVITMLATLITSILVIIVGFMGLVPAATWLVRAWGKLCVFVFGIKVQCRGEENLPSANGGIIVFNHQSHFDIPVIVTTTRRDIRFGAKIELFRIPFFGRAMRAMGHLPIARENRTEVLRIYKEAQVRLKENILFVLAPEGTRQREPRLGRFKKGPFLFAVNAGVPVIPCVIKNAHLVLPKESLSVNIGRASRTITVQYLPPVPTAGVANDGVEALMDRVRAQMVEAYESLPSEI